MTYLSRVPLNLHSRQVRRELADRHELHRTLMRTVGQANQGEQARARFEMLYRVETDPICPRILLQTRFEPDWDALPSGFVANPAETKAIDHVLEGILAGHVLTFRLLANPTRRATGRRVGRLGTPEANFVVVDANGRARGKLIPLRTQAEQLDWLRRRADRCGFEVVPVQASESVSDVRVSMPPGAFGERAGKRLTFGSAQFDGRLRVVDAEAFVTAVRSGIGRGKAYGYGLLSIGGHHR